MSALVIGGNKIDAIKTILQCMRFLNITHLDGRNRTTTCKKEIPRNVDYVLMVTDFINHNVMYKFKNDAKKRNIPVVCSKRSSSCVFCEFCKYLDKDRNVPRTLNVLLIKNKTQLKWKKGF